MTTTYHDDQPDGLKGGITAALILHALAAVAIAAVALLRHTSNAKWGENASSVGAIQASMVSAIPLPQKAPPVDNSVLASEDVTAAPTPPPTKAAQPPPQPQPTDILIKSKNKLPPMYSEIPADAPPKHPQPTKDSPKAHTGDAATQLPQSTSQVKNGTATATVQDRTFGNRYAYYVQIVSRVVAQNWYTTEADPRASAGKRATVIFDINRDGIPTNIHLANRSGSVSLDSSALHALQRVDQGFGPLPAGNSITVEYTFDYKQP
jgi:protein TonB